MTPATMTRAAPRWVGPNKAIEVDLDGAVLAVGPERVTLDGVPLDMAAEECAAALGAPGGRRLVSLVSGVRRAGEWIPGLGSADLRGATWWWGQPRFSYATILALAEREGLGPRATVAVLRDVEDHGLAEVGMSIVSSVSDRGWLALLRDGHAGLIREMALGRQRPSLISMAVLRVCPTLRLGEVVSDVVKAAPGGYWLPADARCQLLDLGAGVFFVRTGRPDAPGPPSTPPSAIAEELAEAGYPPEAILAASVAISGSRGPSSAAGWASYSNLDPILRDMFQGWDPNYGPTGAEAAYQAEWACPLPCCGSEPAPTGRRRSTRLRYTSTESGRVVQVVSPFTSRR